jgi:uncharacterized protein
MRLIKIISIKFIQFYQKHWSKYTGHCRFHPTCSQYAILAIDKHGVLKGTWKTLKRLNRCRPSNTDSCIDYP